MHNITSSYADLSLWTWLKVIVVLACLTGFTSTLFLFALQFVTSTRESHYWLLLFLPIGGLAIIYLYKTFGQLAKKGNNLLLEEYYHPQGKIPWRMAPLIVVTTLITHLFGGSAGREGTAIQYGGTYGDRIATIFRLNKDQNRIALLAGVAAGFASLFGTPLAGIVFALEVFKIGSIRLKALPIIVITAYLSHLICLLLRAPHTHYNTIIVTDYFLLNNLWIVAIAISCGLAARLFILSGNLWSRIFKSIQNEYYRIFIGSVFLLLLLYLVGTTKYIGLGLPSILSSFEVPATGYDFFLKIIFTTLTLSIGFKGGEVTPLFFIGATLASFLSLYIPVPIVIMTGIGFVAVFAGSTKTPLACTCMALELFGWHLVPFALIGSYIAMWVSGKNGIYSSQRNFSKWL